MAGRWVFQFHYIAKSTFTAPKVCDHCLPFSLRTCVTNFVKICQAILELHLLSSHKWTCTHKTDEEHLCFTSAVVDAQINKQLMQCISQLVFNQHIVCQVS